MFGFFALVDGVAHVVSAFGGRQESRTRWVLLISGKAGIIGGELKIHAAPGKGTRIDVTVPLTPQTKGIDARCLSDSLVEGHPIIAVDTNTVWRLAQFYAVDTRAARARASRSA